MHSLRSVQRTTLQRLFQNQSTQQGTRNFSRSNSMSSPLRSAATKFTQSRAIHVPYRRPLSQHLRFRFRQSNAGARRFATAAGEENLSLSQRLRKLSREYGWSALGVYLLLSAADFPFCFMAVRIVGTDRIGHWEHIVVTKIKELVSTPFGQTTQEKIDGAVAEVESTVMQKVPVAEVKTDGASKRILEEEETYVVTDHGYKQAEAANSGSNASLWTQLALAYAIHKSFIFIRVPLTAAVTPKVVKTLRSWGWNIGKRPAKKVTGSASSNVGVNTKGSGVKSE